MLKWCDVERERKRERDKARWRDRESEIRAEVGTNWELKTSEQ